MVKQNREFFKDEESTYLSTVELSRKIHHAEMLLKQLTEEEQQLQLEIGQSEERATLRKEDDPYVKYAMEKAAETAAMIKENAEDEMRQMADQVKKMKADYDREIEGYKERIDTKKHYIVTMLESLVVYLDDDVGSKESEVKAKHTARRAVDTELKELLEKLA